MSIRVWSGLKAVVVCVAMTLVAGCGGGGGGEVAPPTPPPPPLLPLMIDSLGRPVEEAAFGAGDPAAAGADGTAFDAGPLANATVTLTDASATTRTATTDSSGYYRLSVNGLRPPFIARVKRADGSEWVSASASPVQARAFVTINFSGVTDKTLGYVADAAGVASGAASAVTPVMLAANPGALVAAKERISAGLAAPLTNAGLDAAAYDPVTSPLVATAFDGHALFLHGLTLTRNAKGRTAVAGTVAGGASAILTEPLGVAVDPAGNVLVADTVNNVVRKISPAGVMTTLAGTGEAGFADGAAAAASFNRPAAVAADSKGNVYVADEYNHAIRKIDASGRVTTVVGPSLAGSPQTLATDAADNLYFMGGQAILKMTAAGVVSTVAAASTNACCARVVGEIRGPRSLAVDAGGNVYVAGETAIVKITPGGTRSDIYARVADTGFYPMSIAVDAHGVVYAIDNSLGRIWTVAPDRPATPLAGSGASGYVNGVGTAAGFNQPAGLAVDAAGNVLVADMYNHAIRKVTPAGVVSTLAGTRTGFADGTTAALFAAGSPQSGAPGMSSVAVAADGTIFVADAGNHAIRKISPTGTVTTLAGNGSAGFADGNGRSARFNLPGDLALDDQGNVVVADTGNHAIRRISPDGDVTTIAGGGVAGFTDGVGASARFNSPPRLAVGRLGEVYVSDLGNSALRRIDAGGVVSTIAGVGSTGPAAFAIDIVVDSRGVVHFSGAPLNCCIFATAIYSISGDGSIVQRLTPVYGFGTTIAIDARDNLYYSQTEAGIVRVSPANEVTEFFKVKPESDSPKFAVDRQTNLVFADRTRAMVRIVLP